MFVDAIESGKTIHVWFRDEGGIVHFEDDAPFYCYQEIVTSDPEYITLSGKSARKITFESSHEMKKALRNATGYHESDIPALYKYLSDNFYRFPNKILPHIGLFDIEVDFDLDLGFGYPTPENPYGPVNSISLYDSHKNEYHMIMLTDREHDIVDEFDGIPVHQHVCISESQLFNKFGELIEDIDILSAWYGDGFDIPYMYARMRKYKLEHLLCRNDFLPKVEQQMNGDTYVRLVGRAHIDLMMLYKKFIPGEKHSFSLDNVCQEDLKIEKLKYPGDLGELYRTDPNKFFQYSFRDVLLLKKLENKHKLLPQMVSMCWKATIKFTDIFGTIKFLEYAIRNYAHYEKDIPVVLPDKTKNDRKEFPGGYVMKTAPGVYGWVMTIDLTSLYPSVIRALNISPETLLFYGKEFDQDFIKVATQSDKEVTFIDANTGEETTLPAWQMYALIQENGWTISGFGAVFENVEKQKGIIPEVLDTWFELRKYKKKLMIQSEKDAAECKRLGDSEGEAKARALVAEYDLQQKVEKLSMNSLYGAISNPYSRLFSYPCAGSTTMTGQFIEKYQGVRAEKLLSDLSGKTV